MSSFGNPKKDKFLSEIPQVSIESESDLLTTKCKFNFAYFTKQVAGQTFEEWTHEQLSKLLDKLKDYSRESLPFWRQQPCKAGHVLEIYGAFPKSKSDFIFPDHVPHQVEWGRFRLESAVRLVGFVVPNGYKDQAHKSTGVRFDCNTFYIVFLDSEHKFYKTEKK